MEVVLFLVGFVIGGGVVIHVVRRYKARDGTVGDIVRRIFGIPKE